MAEKSIPRQRGRPRSEEKRQAIIQATVELIEDRGLPGCSVDTIAAEAGVSKATVYRWWPNKAAVTLDAVLSIVAPVTPHSETGSAHEDLRRHLRHMINQFRGTRTGAMIAAVHAQAQHDPELAAAVMERVQAPRRAAAKEILRDGIDRGELRADLDPDATLDLLYGPLYYRFLITHEPMRLRYADQVVDQLWPAIAATAKPHPTAASR
jgi:AcrR family transcriptional regulator